MEANSRPGLGQLFKEGLFGLQVGGGDEVRRVLVGHFFSSSSSPKSRVSYRTRLAGGGIGHHFQEGGGGGHGNPYPARARKLVVGGRERKALKKPRVRNASGHFGVNAATAAAGPPG